MPIWAVGCAAGTGARLPRNILHISPPDLIPTLNVCALPKWSAQWLIATNNFWQGAEPAARCPAAADQNFPEPAPLQQPSTQSRFNLC
eukprot:2729115-Rhodomonas_salina.2